MATIETTPKVGYIYDRTGDAWHPIAGAASPDAPYSWTNTHSFNAAVTMANQLIAAMGLNNFVNEAARNNALGPVTGKTPSPGTICFVQSTGRLEFWNTAVSPAAWTQLGTNENVSNAIVRRDQNGDFSARQVTASLVGNANTATTANTATSLTTNTSRTINGQSYNAAINSNFVVRPTTLISQSGTTRLGYNRIFIRNGTSTPGGAGTSIDGTTITAGDIFIGW